ncbi:MutH/Sau3AI family endonuclease [Salinibacillus xinjiangensis]|uniref:DNA mismatch repair MutH/Type II restriction enzyme Sau3AI domain-containing protein n=1 Tax=Salinibacillus xinjiangensis TaxID=1229268 RepID=A0A6G1X4V2_9BACI|nr:MutH/Sau3AI family endonuclease [Salinibacillus xinjiangensis]MRG85972.1 hypothetical protein [Salinibacillus xinjiangensis]
MSFTKNTLELELLNEFEEFIGLSFEEISYKVSINPALISKKASVVAIVNRMLDYKSLDKKELENKVAPMQLSLKTVRLQPNGKPRESMSFENVDFVEITEETWQESKLREKFVESIFLFFVFQYTETLDGKILLFKGVKVWQMPEKTLNTDIKKLWNVIREKVNNGVILKEKKVGNRIVIENNLPGKNDNNVAHIRPKANDGNDKIELPDGQMITKQAYWLNNSYIALILMDMPAVNRRHSNYQKNDLILSKELINSLNTKLSEAVYPIEEFIIKVKQVIPSFTTLDVNRNLLSTLGYKIDKRFVIKDHLESVDQYLYDIIFSRPYFSVPNNPVFVTSYVKRKIDNYENDYKLLKIEKNQYITNNNLLKGGIVKQDLISYKTAVERFVEEGNFFTIRTLKQRFTHELDEYGFEDVFYESILMRPGRLKYLKLADQIVFVKSLREITIDDFVAYLLINSKSMSVDELINRAWSVCNLEIDYDYAIRLMKNTSYFYSTDLLKLYETKEVYYKEIYD